MKKILIYILVIISTFPISGNVLYAQVEKTNDQLCYEQVGPSRYKEWPDSIGGGATCECLPGYDWNVQSLHCVPKETVLNNVAEQQNQEPSTYDASNQTRIERIREQIKKTILNRTKRII